ncbi:hypothetical protein HDU93_001182, partial [Gonapodya sp. JEL0774]
PALEEFSLDHDIDWDDDIEQAYEEWLEEVTGYFMEGILNAQPPPPPLDVALAAGPGTAAAQAGVGVTSAEDVKKVKEIIKQTNGINLNGSTPGKKAEGPPPEGSGAEARAAA